MDAYCWPQSAVAGESIDLMVSSEEPKCTAELVRIGATEDIVATYPLDGLVPQPVPADVGANGCGWSVSLTITVDPTWKSGFYLVRLTAESGSAEAFLAEVYGGLADNYVGELNWVAERLRGEDNAENRAYLEAGAAVMGTYERGAGWVFTTGCTDWAYGLSDPTVSLITRNLINRALINRALT